MIHTLKTWPEYYQEVEKGTKTFEVRKNDRNFKIDDILVLQEYDQLTKEYTGKESYYKITYILKGGFGIEEGMIVMSIKEYRLNFDLNVY